MGARLVGIALVRDARAVEKFLVYSHHGGAVGIGAKPIADGRASPRAEPHAKRAVRAHARQRRAKLDGIPRLDQQSGLAIAHDFGYSSQARGDNRAACPHRENERQRQPFPERRQREHIHRREKVAKVASRAAEGDAILDSQRRGIRLERRALGTIADEHQPDGLEPRRFGDRVEQHAMSLLVLQRGDDTDHDPIGRDPELSPDLVGRHGGVEPFPVDGVVDHAHGIRTDAKLADIRRLHRFR